MTKFNETGGYGDWQHATFNEIKVIWKLVNIATSQLSKGKIDTTKCRISYQTIIATGARPVLHDETWDEFISTWKKFAVKIEEEIMDPKNWKYDPFYKPFFKTEIKS